MSFEGASTPNGNPNFAAKDYMPTTGFIKDSLIRVEETFPFQQHNADAVRLDDENKSYQPYAGKRAEIPLVKGVAEVEERQYEDGVESVYVYMDYASSRQDGRLVLEMCDTGRVTVKLFTPDLNSEIPVEPQDEVIKIMYCSQKLNEAAGLASQ
ncbi:MAG: hypothetical protein WD467_01875 [Candidatus Saccharimonadales bacterium]